MYWRTALEEAPTPVNVWSHGQRPGSPGVITGSVGCAAHKPILHRLARVRSGVVDRDVLAADADQTTGKIEHDGRARLDLRVTADGGQQRRVP